MKTRREFIHGLILSVGGAATLSACGDNAPAVTATAPHNPGRFYTGDEMALVNRVSDLIIPRTETPWRARRECRWLLRRPNERLGERRHAERTSRCARAPAR